MERLREQRPSGINGCTLRNWGMVFVAAGIFGRGIIQNRVLGLGAVSTQQLLEAMQSSEGMMLSATIALILQAVETCAVPIFAFLTVVGFQHTASLRNYLLRMTGMALLSEIPYDLAISGKFFDFSTQNPALGLVLGLVLMYFYQTYADKSMKNFLIKALVTAAGLIWAGMLRIEYGIPSALLIAVLWAFRKKAFFQSLFGATAAIVCSVISPFFLASPMAFLAVHFYNGEKGEGNRFGRYFSYPVFLLVIGLIGMIAL